MADGTVDNAEFSKDIQYFISSGLVKASGQVTPTTTFEYISSWQKEVAQWWSQGIVSDYDYVTSIQYVLDKKNNQVILCKIIPKNKAKFI